MEKKMIIDKNRSKQIFKELKERFAKTPTWEEALKRRYAPSHVPLSELGRRCGVSSRRSAQIEAMVMEWLKSACGEELERAASALGEQGLLRIEDISPDRRLAWMVAVALSRERAAILRPGTGALYANENETPEAFRAALAKEIKRAGLPFVLTGTPFERRVKDLEDSFVVREGRVVSIVKGRAPLFTTLKLWLGSKSGARSLGEVFEELSGLDAQLIAKSRVSDAGDLASYIRTKTNGQRPLFSAPVDAKRLRAAVEESDSALVRGTLVNVGRGRWESLRNLLRSYSDEEIDTIFEVADAAAGNGVSMFSAAYVLDTLGERAPDLASRVDRHALKTLLVNAGRFESGRRLLLRKSGVGQIGRIADLFEEILAAAKRPMGTSKLVERIAQRGVLIEVSNANALLKNDARFADVSKTRNSWWTLSGAHPKKEMR